MSARAGIFALLCAMLLFPGVVRATEEAAPVETPPPASVVRVEEVSVKFPGVNDAHKVERILMPGYYKACQWSFLHNEILPQPGCIRGLSKPTCPVIILSSIFF